MNGCVKISNHNLHKLKTKILNELSYAYFDIGAVTEGEEEGGIAIYCTYTDIQIVEGREGGREEFIQILYSQMQKSVYTTFLQNKENTVSV